MKLKFPIHKLHFHSNNTPGTRIELNLKIPDRLYKSTNLITLTTYQADFSIKTKEVL